MCRVWQVLAGGGHAGLEAPPRPSGRRPREKAARHGQPLPVGFRISFEHFIYVYFIDFFAPMFTGEFKNKQIHTGKFP